MERRYLKTTAEVRDGETPRITGHAAAFYRADDPGTEFHLWEGMVERILPGAFDRAIREDDVRALRNHDPDNLLGRTKSNTLSLSVDDRGLRYDIDPPDSELGRSTVNAIRRGDLDGSSFAFITTDEEWRKENGVHIREIRGVQLFDVGPVTYPAYKASTTGIRSNDLADARLGLEQFEANLRLGIDHYRRRLRLAELRASR